jgi:hypothetical protein
MTLATIFPFPEQKWEFEVSFYNVGTGTRTFPERETWKRERGSCSRSKAAKRMTLGVRSCRLQSGLKSPNNYNRCFIPVLCLSQVLSTTPRPLHSSLLRVNLPTPPLLPSAPFLTAELLSSSLTSSSSTWYLICDVLHMYIYGSMT